MKRKCAKCDWPSLPGLSSPRCAFHWAAGVWSKEWASKCHPKHPEAIPQPCPVPTDPEQRLDIKCAICGIPIDFRKGEVFLYSKGCSYVCKKDV